MEKSKILQELEETFRIFFKNDSIVLTNETVADDIEYWDSLSHIELINTIEKKLNNAIFSLCFKFLQSEKQQNVNKIITTIM